MIAAMISPHSPLRVSSGFALAAALIAAISACAGPATPSAPGAQLLTGPRSSVGLGPVVQSAFGGEIYGWDIDQTGSDAVLSETMSDNSGLLNAIETFDEPSGKITKIVQKTQTNDDGPSPVVDAIAGTDVGLIDDQFDFVKSGKLVRDDKYLEMNPVSGNKITGKWTPPHPLGLDPNFVTDNQGSSSQAMVAYRLTKADNEQALLYMYNVGTNTWQKPYVFPRHHVLSENTQYVAVDTPSNTVVTSYQQYKYPFNPNEVPPTFVVFDASSSKLLRTFAGLGEGYINGMAIDSTTGTMCTTTFGDKNVEFYKVSTGKGFAVQIPVLNSGAGPLNGGAAVAVDQVNHLFLIAQLNSTFSSSGGSTVIVYDEKGHLVENIDGFEFLFQFSAVTPGIAVNGAERLGYVNGPTQSELQEFTY
jgi:hypothetical protein